MADTNIIQSSKNFVARLKDFKELKTFSSKPLEDAVQTLYRSGCSYREELYHGSPEKPHTDPKKQLKEVLKKNELPFHLALKILDVLTLDEMQCYDQLKCNLSKTALIFWEMIILKSKAEGRSIYPKTRNKIQEALIDTLQTLPKKEAETYFALRCLKALTSKVQIGEGKAKEVLKDTIPDLVKGVLSTVLSISPTSVNAAPLVSPLGDLSIRVYKEIGERWYRRIWALNSIASGKRIVTMKQFEKITPLIEDYKKNGKLAFYVSQFFFEIIQNEKAKPNLKEEVFGKGTPNLLQLAEISNEKKIKKFTLRKDTFWKVRYITIKNLKELIVHKGFCHKSMKKLLDCYLSEENPYVSEVISQVFTSLLNDQENNNHIRRAVREVDLEEKLKFCEEKLSHLFKLSKQIAKDKEAVQEAAKQLTEKVINIQKLIKIKSGMQNQSGLLLREQEFDLEQVSLETLNKSLEKAIEQKKAVEIENKQIEEKEKILDERREGLVAKKNRIAFLSKLLKEATQPTLTNE